MRRTEMWELKITLRDLLKFRPVDLPSEPGPREIVAEQEARQELIRLSAEFAVALKRANAFDVLERRSLMLEMLTLPGTSFGLARRGLLGVLRRLSGTGHDVSDAAAGAGQVCDESAGYALFPIHVEAEQCRAQYLLGGDRLSPDERVVVQRWQNELRALFLTDSREGLWGAYLTLLCSATHVLSNESADEGYQLIARVLRDQVRAATAIQVAARKTFQQARATVACGQSRHSRDYRSVSWFGMDYRFTASQAACVALLWQGWENKTPELGQAHILTESGAESSRLVDLFKDHPAWKTMIVEGATKGSYQLKEPTSR